MNTSTEAAICSALYEALQERSMDRVTVKMVCQRAGISRQALYNHYYSLTAVLADALERELSGALNGCAAGRD